MVGLDRHYFRFYAFATTQRPLVQTLALYLIKNVIFLQNLQRWITKSNLLLEFKKLSLFV